MKFFNTTSRWTGSPVLQLLTLLLASGLYSLRAGAELSDIPSGTYIADPTHAYIQIQYSHLGLSNPLWGFDSFDINMMLDTEAPTQSSVSVSIDIGSVDPGSAIFHTHLTSEKWFDSSAFPKAYFNSSEITANRDGTYDINGSLTIKDITRPVTLTATINAAMVHPMNRKPVIGITATGQILRSEWGLGMFAPHISDEVSLLVNVELVAQP